MWRTKISCHQFYIWNTQHSRMKKFGNYPCPTRYILLCTMYTTLALVINFFFNVPSPRKEVILSIFPCNVSLRNVVKRWTFIIIISLPTSICVYIKSRSVAVVILSLSSSLSLSSCRRFRRYIYIYIYNIKAFLLLVYDCQSSPILAFSIPSRSLSLFTSLSLAHYFAPHLPPAGSNVVKSVASSFVFV